MNLQLACIFNEIPAYQAKLLTQASHHLCRNRGSIGGKGLYSKPNKGPKKLAECADWVRKNRNCGTHFSYGWKINRGKCTIDISTGVPCAVSSNYPKKIFARR